MIRTAIDASKLFAKRNRLVSERPSLYYPSTGAVGGSSVKEFVERWSGLRSDVQQLEKVRGRVKQVRSAGRGMCFLDMGGLQVILNARAFEPKSASQGQEGAQQGTNSINSGDNAPPPPPLSQRYRPGDYVLAQGHPSLSSRQRTLSLRAVAPPQILAAAQQPLPPQLQVRAKVKQNRVVDYQLQGTRMLRVRHTVVRALRSFLDERGFVEVETPMLSPKSNGAAAEPFVTHARALPEASERLELRVAPELWLKRLVIAGVEKVYELGKVFRNEGIDATHSPEFTTLEFYEAYATMDDLVERTQQLLLHVCRAVAPFQLPAAQQLERQLEGQPGIRRVEFIPTLCAESGTDFAALPDWADPQQLYAATPEADRASLFPTGPVSAPQMWGKLCEFYIEQRYCGSAHPTLICHHPAVMSPLAKPSDSDERIAQRFELYIGDREYVNAYEEENCPQRQLRSFEAQARALERYGDKEALPVDYEYVEAMKWGMPPTGGFGIGVDRLVLLLLGGSRIEEVLAFGCVDDVGRQ
ncbi:MSK1 (YNL073W) [Zygosaccharomyces parabailii]|nr:MSK1 (YNL073W) [Zygosaccharomyces parabailii]